MRQSRFSKAQGQYCNDDKSTGRKERKMGQDVISFRLIFLFIQLRGGNMALITTLSGIPWYVHVGIGRTLWCFLETKLGRRCQKIWKSPFFFSTLWKFLRPELGQRKHIQAFPLDTKKERVKFGVWNQPSFLFTNQLHSFSCFKQLSPAQHKLDVSNANSLDLIGGCTFIT